MSSSRYSHVAFDLDGTLVRSEEGIQWSVDRAAEEVLDESAPPVAHLIGRPVRQIFEALYPDAKDSSLDALTLAFRANYDSVGWRKTEPYPGVPELLDTLRAAGISAYVVTNKPAAVTERLLSGLDLRRHLDTVASRFDGTVAVHADKGETLSALLTTQHVDPGSLCYVGDSAEDRCAARSAGVAFIAAGYGYGDAAKDLGASDPVLDDPAQLAAVLGLESVTR